MKKKKNTFFPLCSFLKMIFNFLLVDNNFYFNQILYILLLNKSSYVLGTGWREDKESILCVR